MCIERRIILRLSGFFILAIAWKIVGSIRSSPALPPLNGILWMVFCLIRDKTFWNHIIASIELILFGVGMATVIGFIIGLLIFRYDQLKEAVLPVIESVRGIAALTLFPLLIILFGIDTFSRVFIIFWTAWPAIVLSTINSLNVDTNIVDAAKVSGAGEWRTIISIRIPLASQGIITGIRIGTGGGWVSLIAAEMLGASKGIGFYLLWSAQSFQFEKVYATIIVIATIGGLMNYCLLLLQIRAYQMIE